MLIYVSELGPKERDVVRHAAEERAAIVAKYDKVCIAWTLYILFVHTSLPF